MKLRFKIPGRTLACIRADLRRRHAFAHERVGFLTAGATWLDRDSALLLARDYRPVEDADYVPDPTVGVQIGSEAMRKAAEFAYRSRSALFHIHMHGGRGRPEFSGVDLRSGREFVPGFFNVVSRMPHGMLVLSEDVATGMFWRNADDFGIYITQFIDVGAPQTTLGARP